MPDAADISLNALLQRLYRQCFGKMTGHLLFMDSSLTLADAEDMVQEAFTSAAATWPRQLPAQPEAWLYGAVRNLSRRRLARKPPVIPLTHLPNAPAPEGPPANGDLELLRLLFACMHAKFPPKVQLITALRYVFSLQVQQIGELLGMEADSISKVLYRQRQQLRAGDIAFRSGFVWWSAEKVQLALKALYIIFTEGWKIQDESLCEDALSLTRETIRRARVCVPDAKALYALMLFQLSRWNARTGPMGELLELEHQDRAAWNHDMIRVATGYLKQAAVASAGSPYHFEASIAYFHATAASFSATPWLQIAGLYRQLSALAPSPFITLNHAIALHFAGQTRAALEMLAALEKDTFMRHHHLLHATLARIHADQGHPSAALLHYRKALQGKPTAAEAAFIRTRIAGILGTKS
ncbi:DUF6596 domain-containing protein [Chitinophaga sp.]|uniref:RNA polymerase sigma factor n=1 Tax=Chitinophaga sp. TaxID=1869181 RepID=UPI00261F4ECA|nr:DUF6596 domain-containing protein [uncultured Chitinophaga sp.]